MLGASAYVMFANAPLAKSSHMTKPRFKKPRNELHLLMREVAKLHCKGVCLQARKKFVAIYSIHQTPKGMHAAPRNSSGLLY